MEHLTTQVSILPKGTALSRFMLTLADLGEHHSADRVEEYAARWSGTPQVARAFELSTKALVAPGTTTDAQWAGALAQTGIQKEALDLLRGQSVVAQLSPKMQAVPFGVKVSIDATTAAFGGWIAEGAPTPMGSLTFDSVGPFWPMKIGAAVAVTRELVQAGGPTAETSIRTSVLGNLAKTMDRLFLDPTIAGGATPASVTNGAVAIVSSGSTAAAIQADLAAMVASITTAGAGLTWIMQPTTAAHVAGALGSASDMPRSLHGLPVALSANALDQITLVDLSAILLADEGAFEVSRTENALVRMDNAPTDATVPTSLYQQNLVGLKALRWLHWLRPVPTSVSYMLVSY